MVAEAQIPGYQERRGVQVAIEYCVSELQGGFTQE